MSLPQPAHSTSHRIDANGIQLHYLDYGVPGRRPMLCVHGAAAHAHWFDYVAAGFTPAHHVRALDLRGHGDSAWAEPRSYSFGTYAEDIDAVANALDLRDFVLVGHSMGGMASLLYAAIYPGRVGRLVVIDSIMLMPMERVQAMRAFGATTPSTNSSQDELVARYRLSPPETHLADPEIIRHMALNSGRQGADGRWQHKADRRVYGNAQQIAGLPLWDRIKVPALVVKGSRSTRFRAPEMAEIGARAPQVQWAEVPDSNHHITLDNPQGLIDAMRGFLGQ
jgi:pimeloyl-ACP methyl ester carboxylesterase